MDITVESKKIKQTRITARVTNLGELRDFFQACKDAGIDPATSLSVSDDYVFTVEDVKEIVV